MSVVIEARDEMIKDLKKLAPGSVELLNQTQAIRTMSEIDLNDRKHEFEVEKEETRKMEKSNERIYAEYDRQLMWIDRGLRLLEIISNPLAAIKRTSMINKVKILRDEMGYHYEDTGVIGSHTLNNALKDNNYKD